MVIFVNLTSGGERHGFAFDDETGTTRKNGSESICLPQFGTVSSKPDEGIRSVRVINVEDRELPVTLQEFVNAMALAGWRWIASDQIHSGLWVPIIIRGNVMRLFDAMYGNAGATN